MNWGWRLVFSMAAFMSFIIILGVFMMREQVDLVTDKYYQKGLDHDVQARKIENGNLRADQIQWKSSAQHLEITFDSQFSMGFQEGMVKLYRPSDAKLDFSLPINMPRLSIHDPRLKSGLWKAQVQWKMKTGEEGYLEKSIQLP